MENMVSEKTKSVTDTPGKQKKRTVCVIGHKNPDTDSICSAIAYADLKNQTDDKDYNYRAVRAGQISAETQYVLERFEAKTPQLLENIGTRVKDMEIRSVPGVGKSISLKKAWTLMMTQHVFTLPITNEQNQIEGLITINDIAKSLALILLPVKMMTRSGLLFLNSSFMMPIFCAS